MSASFGMGPRKNKTGENREDRTVSSMQIITTGHAMASTTTDGGGDGLCWLGYTLQESKLPIPAIVPWDTAARGQHPSRGHAAQAHTPPVAQILCGVSGARSLTRQQCDASAGLGGVRGHGAQSVLGDDMGVGTWRKIATKLAINQTHLQCRQRSIKEAVRWSEPMQRKLRNNTTRQLTTRCAWLTAKAMSSFSSSESPSAATMTSSSSCAPAVVSQVARTRTVCARDDKPHCKQAPGYQTSSDHSQPVTRRVAPRRSRRTPLQSATFAQDSKL